MRKPCLASVLVTWHTMPLRSGELTVYVMSRCCRSANVLPSVTRYCTVLTFELSIVG